MNAISHLELAERYVAMAIRAGRRSDSASLEELATKAGAEIQAALAVVHDGPPRPVKCGNCGHEDPHVFERRPSLGLQECGSFGCECRVYVKG